MAKKFISLNVDAWKMLKAYSLLKQTDLSEAVKDLVKKTYENLNEKEKIQFDTILEILENQN